MNAAHATDSAQHYVESQTNAAVIREWTLPEQKALSFFITYLFLIQFSGKTFVIQPYLLSLSLPQTLK